MVEGITCAPAVTGRVLLDAAASLTWGLPGECDDVTGSADAGCVRGAGQGDGVLAVPGRGSSVTIRTPARKSFPRSAPRSCTRCQAFPGSGPLKRAVGCSFPRVAAMPVSSRAAVASVLVVPHASHRLWVPACLRSGRGSDAACRHGLIGDHTVFHVVPNWRASPEIAAPSTRTCRIAQRLTRAPQTRPGSTHRVVMLQERHRLAGSFTAHPTPYYATGSAQRPRLRARRSPPPPYDRDREQVTPQPGQPTSWLHDSTSSTRASGVRATPIRWKPSKPTSRSHRS